MSAFLQIVLAGLFPVLAIVAALTDLTSYTIPNWIPLGLAAAFGLLAATIGLPLGALGPHALAGAAALLAGMGLFALGWIGGGDAKLLAAGCLWFGWPGAQAFLFDTALAGGAFAGLLLLARGQPIRALWPLPTGWVARLITPGEPAPYGVAIAIGALAAFPSADLLRLVHPTY
jgi:prepilin peptidase CpaA